MSVIDEDKHECAHTAISITTRRRHLAHPVQVRHF